ncbi:MAG: hypothetical protein WC497_04075 [Patescibacteria group bacterium]
MFELFDTPALCQALRLRRRSGLQIPRIILGPNIDPETVAALEALASEGVIRLFRSPQPQSVHFMVSGQKSAVLGNQQNTLHPQQLVIYDHPGIATLFSRRSEATIRAGLAQPFITDH